MTTGPGDALEAAGRRHLRASHADRERVIGTLKAAFVQGMLTKDELDLRVGQTFASRTYGDLAAITADLPAGLAAAQPPAPVRTPGGQRVLRPGPVIAGASAVYAGMSTSVVYVANHSVGSPWAPPLVFGGFLVYLFILIMSVAQMIALRREKRSGGQSSRRPGGRSGIPAPAISRPGQATPASRSRSAAHRRSSAKASFPPVVAGLSGLAQTRRAGNGMKAAHGSFPAR